MSPTATHSFRQGYEKKIQEIREELSTQQRDFSERSRRYELEVYL